MTMGLLDATDDETQNAAISNGLLNFVAMANKKRPFMGLLAGLQGYEQTQASAKDRALRMAMEERKLAMEEEFKRAQIGEYQAQAQQRLAAIRDGEAKASEAGRIQSLVRGAGTVQPMEAVPMQDARGVTGERKTPDYTWLMQQGVPPELVKQLAESRNFGRDKVGGQFDTVMPGTNRAGTQLRSEYGDAMGSVVAKPIEFGMADTGARLVPYDKSNPTAMGKEQTLESRASTGLGYSRLAFDKEKAGGDAQNAAMGRIPPGYRMKADGSMEAVPGGPADIKAGEAGARAEKSKAAGIAQADSVLVEIGDAKKLAGWNTTGVGGLAAFIPATDAKDLQGKLTTIKANLGFDRLQQMREASPTGGALGQVAVQELVALQATVASLDQMQSRGQVVRALDKIDRHYRAWQKTLGPGDSGQSKVRRFNPETGQLE